MCYFFLPGIYPISVLRPKYKNLGAPVPVIPIPGVNDNPDARPDAEAITYGSIESYALSANMNNNGVLENFNVRTLYDKLEDQTLHISSQLARHQTDLRGFYDRISQQTEGLKDMLDKLDVSKLAQATQMAAMQGSGDGHIGQEQDEMKGLFLYNSCVLITVTVNLQNCLFGYTLIEITFVSLAQMMQTIHNLQETSVMH